MRTKYKQLRTNSANSEYKLAHVESRIRIFSNFQAKNDGTCFAS